MILLIATVLMFGASGYLMQRAIGLASPWMGLMLFLSFLGLARVAEPLYRLRVPRALRPLRRWETGRHAYRWLAVPQFGALLRETPLRFLNANVYVAKHRRDPLDISIQVESAEAIHFWAVLLLLPYLVYCAFSGRWAVLGCFLAVQSLGNVYPILHLRLVRGRLERAMRRARATGA